MRRNLIYSFILFCISNIVCANSNDSSTRFERIVLSKNVIANCGAENGDERGVFSIDYKDGPMTHQFLVMTGVYYDTCKGLEKKINRLKRKESKIILTGTIAHVQGEKNEVIWRWEAVKSLSNNVCISYFANDCF